MQLLVVGFIKLLGRTNTTVSNAASSLAFQLIKQYISNPIFAAMGNHEPAPVNQVTPLAVSDAPVDSAMLLQFLQSEWSQLLPSGSS